MFPYSNDVLFKYKTFCSADRPSSHTRTIKNNLMHYLSSIDFVSHLYMFRVCYCPSSGGITVGLYVQ
jgi:hypothetical protein